MSKLIGLSERVEQIRLSQPKFVTGSIGMNNSLKTQFWYKTISYNKFIRQTLELYQFIPCKLVNGQWEVLEKPEYYSFYLENEPYMNMVNFEKCKEYQEADKRVLFKGFTVAYCNKSEICLSYRKDEFIEHFLYLVEQKTFIVTTKISDLIKYRLELTKTGEKQAGYIN